MATIGNSNSIDFSSVKIDYSHLPQVQSHIARDGESLEYRRYRSDSDCVLILIHGSGWHSQYFYPLANKLASQGVASVYTPNLRGHGVNPKRRGDVEYIGQLDDDLEDFVRFVSEQNPGKKIILGGHSSKAPSAKARGRET